MRILTEYILYNYKNYRIRKSRLASDETNSSNSKRHSDNETKSVSFCF